MLSQMQQQESADAAKDERAQRRAQNKEEQAEKAAENAQRRSTRVAVSTVNEEDDEDITSKTKSRGRPKKSAPAQKAQQGKLSSYFSKEEVAAKAGEGTVGAALQEAVDDDVKTGDIGIQNLQSAQQPKLVTGGTMRKYQLEGLEWLKSLYENGLNGILADEMGLGKTIQTISFLAFLREMETYGPFLVACPLSTTSNWVSEIQRWTPEIPVMLYHGSIAERAELRKKHLKNPGSKTFPVVITGYEICMNDRKHLADLGWKFIIIVCCLYKFRRQ